MTYRYEENEKELDFNKEIINTLDDFLPEDAEEDDEIDYHEDDFDYYKYI